MMPADGLERLRASDAIFLGAIGAPSVPDHVSVWELILPIRQRFEQYVNLRPMRLLPGVTAPLARPRRRRCRLVCVRENSEGEYAGVGGRLHRGTPHEVAEQTGLFTRRGIERVVALRLRAGDVAAAAPAGQRHQVERPAARDGAVGRGGGRSGRRLPAASPSAGITSTRWRHAWSPHPQTLDVIVASNLFGDILTDLGAAVSGSLGVAPGANLNPERQLPVDVRADPRSAPDIAGKGIANPIGAIWAAALMLDHLGQADARQIDRRRDRAVLAEGRVRTPDLGGTATTAEVTAAVTARLG